MGHMPTLISDLALILTVAGLMTLLCKKINQPAILGYILAGVLIGPVVKFLPTGRRYSQYYCLGGYRRYLFDVRLRFGIFGT